MRKVALASLALSAALFSAACGDDAFGDLVIDYQIGSGSESCSTQEITTVRVTLTNPERSAQIEDGRCSDTRSEMLIRGVPVDVYNILVEGLNGQDEVIFQYEEQNVRVNEGVENTVRASLSVVPPGLRVNWDFPSGFCRSNNVDQLHVRLWQDGIRSVYDNDEIDCLEETIEITDLMPGEYDVKIRAIDATSGDYTFAYDTPERVTIEAGQRETVMATLEACANGCDAP